MTLRELITQYRSEHGLSQRQFAMQCSLSNGYISMLERGLNPKTQLPLTPTLPALKKLATGMGISLSELISVADDMPVSLVSDEPENGSNPIPSNVQPMPTMQQIPRIGMIACGDPLLAQQNIEGYDNVPEYVKCDFTLVCRGDSMINARIFDGDIVCIREQPAVENGEIAAVLIDSEEATLKRVKIFDDHIVLEPENPMYKPLVFWGEEMNNVRILGKATHFISRVD